MRVRVLLEPRYGATYDQLAAMAKTVEESGFDAFFRSDHYLGIDADDTSLVPTDSWTTIGGLTRETSRVRLGTLMTAATFRHPGQLAVVVATADAMSGGRVELGIGTGWYEREHQYFGIPFPPTGERFDRLEEALAIITGIWDTPPGERFSFEGRHWRVDGCANFPRPVQRPHPRIIVGGVGPKRTPRIAALYADEFNAALSASDSGVVDNFRRICEEVGRDPATVTISTVLPVSCGATKAEAEARGDRLGDAGRRLLSAGVVGTPADVVARAEASRELGADVVYFHIYDGEDLDQIRLLGQEVVPALT
ncbi:MAG: TIGR03560 family F420-dependent LLM class oxidoreductase [Acidimicrobiales bacterium]